MGDTPIILASQSPRRAQLLGEAGISFEIATPRYGEPEPEQWPHSAIDLAESTSYFKAASVADEHPGRIILGADTTVASEDGRLFGKAADAGHARRILGALMGTTHQVITGVTLLDASDMRRQIAHDVTHVTMRRMTDAELDAYIDGGEWEGKAGAYGIQDSGDRFIEHIQGSFSNVVGLPIELVAEMLKQFLATAATTSNAS